MLSDIKYSKLVDLYAQKRYKFFHSEYDLNIFGIRSPQMIAGEWDDTIGVAYVDEKLNSHIELFKGTTDPSDKWLMKPFSKKGTLILLEGQYRGAYKLGIHGHTWSSGGYVALEQIKPMRYVRDNTLDNKLDIIGENVASDVGIYKTNIHRASKWSLADRVGSYSAGCQVIQDINDFNRLIDLCRKQLDSGLPNSFTYTLFSENDFR